MKFFNQVSLQTPESVELDFTLAGIGNRAYALLIDYIVWGLTLSIFSLAWFGLAGLLSESLSNFLGGFDQFELWLFSLWLLIFFFIYVGYFVFFETLWQGQTPGKRVIKIRVIRDDGRPVGLQQAILRTLLRPVDDLFFIGTFFILLGKQEKRIGDLVAGTLVIQDHGLIIPANFPISDTAYQLVTQLKIEADLSRLSPEEFTIIRDYLQRRNNMTSEAKKRLSKELAYQVKDIIRLETVPPETTATQFLEAVYLAYQDSSD